MEQIKAMINKLICFGFVCFLTAYTFGSYAFGSQEANSNPCPTELLEAILSHRQVDVEDLLDGGADPNASLENCSFPIKRPALFGLGQTYYDLTIYSKLLHVAALFTNYYLPIYEMLIEHGAKEDVRDHRGLTPHDIATSDTTTIYVGGQFRVR